MQENELQQHVKNGLSTRQIASLTGVSQTNVRYWLKKYQLNVSKKKFDRKCGLCGETSPDKFYGMMKFRCASCQNKYSVERGRNNKKKIIQHLGGKCVICGFDKYECSIQVHHVDPTKKDPTFGSHRGWAWNRVVKELEGCVLLCGICHPAVHAGILTIDM